MKTEKRKMKQGVSADPNFPFFRFSDLLI